MGKTNEQIVDEVSQKIQAFLQHYFNNMNSGMSPVTKTDQGNYIIPSLRVTSVQLNLLDKKNEGQKIVTSEVGMLTREVSPISPLVRVLLPIEEVMEFNDNISYLKLSIWSIVTDVQKSWEKSLGSYKTERFGDAFLSMRPLSIVGGDRVALDFYGDWATNKEAE